MLVSILFHLYQPPQQNAYVFNTIADSCYFPLVKLLKYKKDFKVTLNTPLSLLEWFEKEKKESFFSDLKSLVNQSRVELVGSAAYHPILTKIDYSEAERQVILNECGVSYYLGRTEGFEGEPLLMIKNLKGFFAPEMALNSEILTLLNDLSYDWAVVDEVHLTADFNHISKFKDSNLYLPVRNRDLSLCLAYKRDSDPEDFVKGINYLSSQGHKFVFVAVDGETIGHHNAEGVELLENIIDSLLASGHAFSTYSEVVKEYKSKKEESISEASWGASEADKRSSNLYPKWYLAGNEIHEAFMTFEKLFTDLAKKYPDSKNTKKNAIREDANVPIWNFNKLSLASDIDNETKSLIKSRIMIDKSFNSDKYWWSSNNPYFDVHMIKRSLELYMKVLEKFPFKDDEFVAKVKDQRDKILSLVKV